MWQSIQHDLSEAIPFLRLRFRALLLGQAPSSKRLENALKAMFNSATQRRGLVSQQLSMKGRPMTDSAGHTQTILVLNNEVKTSSSDEETKELP